MLGHNNKEETRKTAKTISWNLKPGNMESFYSCAADNDKQKNPKRIEQKPKPNKGAYIYIDIATLKNPKELDVTVTKPHWKTDID